MSDLELDSGRILNEGEEIYWELASTGAGDNRPVVVLTHGAGGSHAIWYQQVPALGQRFRVITWDSRGFGNSTCATGELSPERAGSDLAAVLDHLEVQRAHLVGQSLGGWHINGFALAHPDRVLSLTYADTVGGMWTDELRAAMAEFAKAGGLGGGRTVPLVGGHRALWPGTAARDQAHAFLYQALGSFHSPPMHRLGEVTGWTIEHDQIARLGVPTLFVAGTHDQIFPAPLLAASAALIPARFVEIPGSGHSPYFEQPSVWNDAVLDFLDRTR